MRVLLDTNIVIHRENVQLTNYSIGHLFNWLDKLKYEKVIHPFTIMELQKYQDEKFLKSLNIKIDCYNTIKTIIEPDKEFLDKVSEHDKTENDRIDNVLLYEVYKNRVDILITEDIRLCKKAIRIGIGNKVFTINQFITKCTCENPSLIEYKVLAVKKKLFGEIDFSNSFFNSFKDDYKDFEIWFHKKCDETAYLCEDEKNNIFGFLYIKTENVNENYTDITPVFMPKKRLKIGTFKVESTGFRLGERFLKIIFDNALARNVDEIYVTLFTQRAELKALVELMKRWGFYEYGVKESKNGKETVLVKTLKSYNYNLSPKMNFPNLQYNSNKLFLPINPEYHTKLIPDSILNNESSRDFIENKAYRYALQKSYISFTYKRNMKQGDYIIIYRNGTTPNRKMYESCVTSLGVIEEVRYDFKSKSEYLEYCENRTVFSHQELEKFWELRANQVVVIKFIYVCSFQDKLILKFLWDNNIVKPCCGPRSFDILTNNQFDLLIRKTNTNIKFVD